MPDHLCMKHHTNHICHENMEIAHGTSRGTIEMSVMMSGWSVEYDVHSSQTHHKFI